MWKASAGHNVPQQNNADDDDWETDPDFVNDVTEEEQRWGAKTIAGSGRTAGAIDMAQLREETEKADAEQKKKELEIKNPGLGYGGKFGIEKDRMDKCAVGHDYIGKVEKHGSQKDYSEGFGGKFGVQKDRVDKSAAGWDHKEKIEKHSSQKDYATGFGGKFGVQNDRVDKSAVGWDHVEKVEKHESQKDYSKCFGGKFGVQEDRKDKSAVGWDYVEKTQAHESQVDHKVGFGGKFGVQNDRMDKSAVGFKESKDSTGTNYTKVKPEIGGAKPSNIRARFENFAKEKEEEDLKRAAEQKRIREEKDRLDREQASKNQQNGNDANETAHMNHSRKSIETGRSGGIGNAINMFNKPDAQPAAPIQRKEPIKIPKAEPEPVRAVSPVHAAPSPVQVSSTLETQLNMIQQQPDVIPTHKESVQPEIIETLPPPAAFSSRASNGSAEHFEQDWSNSGQGEDTYMNLPYQANAKAEEHTVTNVKEDTYMNLPYQSNAIPQEPAVKQVEEETYMNLPYQNAEKAEEPTVNTAALVGNETCDLSEIIEDTKIRAIALYDYQASAEDEISFDPNDIITHIEQIDEGWWSGLCKNRYGLFPANYVQLEQ